MPIRFGLGTMPQRADTHNTTEQGTECINHTCNGATNATTKEQSGLSLGESPIMATR